MSKKSSKIIGLRDALSGMKWAWEERNFKVHILALVLVIVLGIGFGLHVYEWMAIILVSALVIGLEMLNTAIEEISDLVQPYEDQRIGRIKDLAAGAVLVSAFAAVIIGALIFAPKLWIWIMN